MNANDNVIVITGIGVVTPLGNDNATFCQMLLDGTSGARPIVSFDATRLPTCFAAEVKDRGELAPIPDVKVAFGLAAAQSARCDAERHAVPLREYYSSGGGLSIGIGLELFSMPDLVDYLGRESAASAEPSTYAAAGGVHPLLYLQTPSDICVHLIAKEHGIDSCPMVHISACAASTDALGAAFQRLRSGRVRWVLAGGTDSMVNPLGVGGFCKLTALSRRNGAPDKASRPFDKDRDGFVLGEGAAMFVMERRADALARGASIYGELAGYGNSFDAYGISEPHPEGEGAYLAMSRALASAGIGAHEIVYVNAHGTSTPKNDVIETHALKRLLGQRAYEVPVSSTKSMIGHLISASGAVEVAAILLCKEAGYYHPTINLKNPDPECDLDYLTGGKQDAQSGYYLKNSFAFGGQNAALVFRVD